MANSIHTGKTDPIAALQIIHLSDLHFGVGHRFDPIPTPDGDPPSHKGHPSLLESLVDDLKEPEQPDYPVLISITGDFGNDPAKDLIPARIFLEGLMKSPILGKVRDRQCFSIIPGNHDVVYNQLEDRDRWIHWAALTKDVFEPVFNPDDPWSFPALQDRFDTLRTIVLTVNSCAYVHKGRKDENRGEVDPQSIQQMDEALQGLSSDKLKSSIRVALIHHHPVLYPAFAEAGRGYDTVINSGALLQLLRRYEFHLVLHGHKHLPHISTYDARVGMAQALRPILIVGGGSVGKRELPSLARENSYNRITIKWNPQASEARIVVRTRILRYIDAQGHLIHPHAWRWVDSVTEDRTFAAPFRLPRPSQSSAKIELPDPAPEQRRLEELNRLRGNMPVVEILPSLKLDKTYEARVWLARDKNAPAPLEVVWSVGPGAPALSVKRSDSQHFCAAIDYNGPMCIQAQVRFEDGEIVLAHLYARLPQAYDQRLPGATYDSSG